MATTLADDIFKYIFLNENNWITIQITVKFVPRSLRRIADVCFELHFRVTPGQFRSAAVG